MAKKKIPFIEECGTGRQWTSTAACAYTIGTDSKTLNLAISTDTPINGKWYFKIHPNDSICWGCKNTIEGKCDLFTKRISKPPKGAKYTPIKVVNCSGRKYTVYKVNKCNNYVPETVKTIIQ